MCARARLHTLFFPFSSLPPTANICNQCFNRNNRSACFPFSSNKNIIFPLIVETSYSALYWSVFPQTNQTDSIPPVKKYIFPLNGSSRPAPRLVRGLRHMLSLTNSPPSPCFWTDTRTQPPLSSVTPLPVGVRFQWNAPLKPFGA